MFRGVRDWGGDLREGKSRVCLWFCGFGVSVRGGKKV